MLGPWLAIHDLNPADAALPAAGGVRMPPAVIATRAASLQD